MKDRVRKDFFWNFYVQGIRNQVEANEDATVLATKKNVIFESNDLATIA